MSYSWAPLPEARRPDGLLIALCGALAVVVAAAVVVPLVVTRPPGGSGDSQQAPTAMKAALVSSLTATAVHVTLSGQETGAGKTETLSGQLQLDDGGRKLTLVLSVQSNQVHETVDAISLPGDAYVKVTGETGWIEEPTGDTSSTGLGDLTTAGKLQQELSTLLAEAKAHGATFTTLGTSTRDGTGVHGYQLTISLTSKGDTSLGGLGSEHGDVALAMYVGTTGHLQSAVLTAAVEVAAQKLSADATLTFSGYGQDRPITAPPAATVHQGGSGGLGLGLGQLI